MRYAKCNLIFFLGLCTIFNLGKAQPLDLVELWRMGGTEDDDVLFGTITSVGIDSKDQVYVVDWAHPGIYVFSNTGVLVTEIGREGRGPGEFQGLGRAVISDSDTVFAWDRRMKRMTIFSPKDYDVVETVLADWEVLGSPFALIGVAPEGFVLDFTHMFMQNDPRTDLTRDIYLLDRDGVQRTPVLAQLPVRKMILFRFSGASGFWFMPFGGIARHTMSGTGLVYSGHGDSTFITVRSTDGRVKRKIDLTHVPVPVTSEDLEEHFKQVDASRRYRRTLREAGIPKIKPMFQHFVVDDQERLWIQLSAAYGAKAAMWTILDEDGTPVNSTELPTNVRLEAVRKERAYGVLKKNNGVEVLVAYAIQ